LKILLKCGLEKNVEIPIYPVL